MSSRGAFVDQEKNDNHFVPKGSRSRGSGSKSSAVAGVISSLLSNPYHRLILVVVGGILFFVFTSAIFGPEGRDTSRDENDEHPLDTIYIIPGGGPGDPAGSGYPDWTRQRTLAAVERFRGLPDAASKARVAFLALSAGSLNAANKRLSDGTDRIIFECTNTMRHLYDLGIDKKQVFGDFMSWDTVSNALMVRLFADGLDDQEHESYFQAFHTPLYIEVFISDFHAARMRAALEWVLYLEPNIPRKITLQVSCNVFRVFHVFLSLLVIVPFPNSFFLFLLSFRRRALCKCVDGKPNQYY